ncbi:ANTAR domain-containing response regulator [Alloiococcus sp. CFN-8]|uniref:ANTAR domain-containing response regulator n=1 Tax=Alloiococcus sp. CFN-8 TaxID=3416081 RepID=UPI003CEC9A53
MESILIVSGSENNIKVLEELILSKTSMTVNTASTGEEAKIKILKNSYQLILISAPLIDDTVEGLALFLSESTISGIIVILKVQASKESVLKLQEEGVVILNSPLKPSSLAHGIESGIAMNKRLLKLKKENVKMQKKLQDLQLVFRAKLILMEHFTFNEEEAHKFLQKRSMDMRQSLEETAEDIITIYGKH